MRLIDADKLKIDLRTSNDCQNCPYNGQSLCRKSCPVNEFADLVDRQPTLELCKFVERRGNTDSVLLIQTPHGNPEQKEGNR